MKIGSDRSLFILQGDRPFYSIKVDRPARCQKVRSIPKHSRSPQGDIIIFRYIRVARSPFLCHLPAVNIDGNFASNYCGVSILPVQSCYVNTENLSCAWVLKGLKVRSPQSIAPDNPLSRTINKQLLYFELSCESYCRSQQ